MTTNRGRILVIEDDVSIAKVLEAALTHEGYAVTVAHEHAQGLVHLQHEPFDIVIIDTDSSVWDPALAFLDELRPHAGAARIVLNTAHAEAGQIDLDYHGLAAVWLKPYDDLHLLLSDLHTLLA